MTALVLALAMATVLTGCGHKDQPTSTGSGTPTAPTAPPTPPAEPPTPPGPPTCVYAGAADPDDFDRDGGNGRLTIGTTAGCKWTIKSDATWLAVEGPVQGDGPATLKFTAGANEEAPDRRATLVVADKSVVISQPGQGDCAYQVTPTYTVLPRAGRTADIIVTTTAGCRWTATTDAAWLQLGAASASGSGRLSYRADANPGTGRDGFRSTQIKIRWQAPTAGQNVSVAQGGTCSLATYRGQFTDTMTVGAAGGSFRLSVLTEPFMNCPWFVTTADSWLTVDSPRSGTGSGDGDIVFTVAANPSGQSRLGVLDFGEVLFKVVQAAR